MRRVAEIRATEDGFCFGRRRKCRQISSKTKSGWNTGWEDDGNIRMGNSLRLDVGLDAGIGTTRTGAVRAVHASDAHVWLVGKCAIAFLWGLNAGDLSGGHHFGQI